MAKLDSPCMFCGDLPCTCDTGKSAPKRAPRKLKSAIPAQPTKDAFDFDSVVVPVAAPKFKAPEPTPETERDLSFESALRALRPIVSTLDQKKIDNYLHRDLPTDLDRRLVNWRNREVP